MQKNNLLQTVFTSIFLVFAGLWFAHSALAAEMQTPANSGAIAQVPSKAAELDKAA